MRPIIYQIVAGSEENASRGVPVWVVWSLVVIVILLLVFILIRDKRARGGLKKFFTWIANKIRVARLKARIGKKVQERSRLMIQLGQTIWEKQIVHPEIEPEVQEIRKLKEDEATLIHEIQKLDDEIQKLKTRSEEANQDQEARISEIEKEKKPLDLRHKELVRERDSIETSIKENEKSRTKVARTIENHMRELEKVDRDEYLSKIEKDMKRKEQEKEIEALKEKQPRIQASLTKAGEEKEKIGKRIADSSIEIKKIEDRLNGLKKEYRERQTKDEEEIENLQKSRKALSIKKIGLQKQLSILFEKLGEKINQKRIESEALKAIYSSIDQLNKNIHELEQKIK